MESSAPDLLLPKANGGCHPSIGARTGAKTEAVTVPARAYSVNDGRILWEFNTGRSFDAVNGGRATGGSIDHGGQVVADRMLFVTSGGRARPGNALLAFTVDR
jgi:hypothetical protein